MNLWEKLVNRFRKLLRTEIGFISYVIFIILATSWVFLGFPRTSFEATVYFLNSVGIGLVVGILWYKRLERNLRSVGERTLTKTQRFNKLIEIEQLPNQSEIHDYFEYITMFENAYKDRTKKGEATAFIVLSVIFTVGAFISRDLWTLFFLPLLGYLGWRSIKTVDTYEHIRRIKEKIKKYGIEP